MMISSQISRERIEELDGIRGLAILLVIGYHYVSVAVPAESVGSFAILRKIFSYGWTGVDLFFVLSGFLIAGILIEHRDATNYFQVFYIRRVSRIFPVYFFFLGLFSILRISGDRIVVLAPEQFVSPISITSFALFLQNFSMVRLGDFGNEYLAVTWSLAIEEQFYLLLPFLIRKVAPDKLWINLLFWISIPLLLRNMIGSGFLGFVLTPWRLDSLMLGALMAALYRSPKFYGFIQKHSQVLIAIFLFLLFRFGFIFATGDVGALEHYFFFAIFYTALLLMLLEHRGRLLGRMFRVRFLKFIGVISFSLYLFHQMVNGVMHDLFFHSLPAFSNQREAAVTILSLLTTIGIAYATFHLFEKKFIGFSHKFNYRSENRMGDSISQS